MAAAWSRSEIGDGSSEIVNDNRRLERFEDLLAWQEARKLTQAVCRATKNGALGRDYAMKDQMQRAAVSVMSNVAEGFERGFGL